jgi:hypothetical protein
MDSAGKCLAVLRWGFLYGMLRGLNPRYLGLLGKDQDADVHVHADVFPRVRWAPSGLVPMVVLSQIAFLYRFFFIIDIHHLTISCPHLVVCGLRYSINTYSGH